MYKINEVTICGNLGRDPEVRQFQNGGSVCNLRVATSETWKDRDTGERRERTEWHSVAIFNEALVKLAEISLKKGSGVYLRGKLQTRKWQDQAGNDRYSTEIVLQGFRAELGLMDPPPGNRPPERDGAPDGPGGSGYGGSSSPDAGADTGAPGGGIDDEIPF